jgi:P-type Cu2+ transporter
MLSKTPGTTLDAASAEPDANALCEHCDTPLTSEIIWDDKNHAFCCGGCRSAFGIIQACGLDDYYRLRDSFSTISAAARPDQSSFEEFDHPTFHEIYVRAVSGGCQTEFYLPSVHCAACVWLIERLPSIVPGVVDVRVDLARSTVQLTWRPEATPLSAVARTLDELGYTPHPVSPETWQAVHDRSSREELGWLAVAGACAGNNMLLALAIYAGEFSGMAVEHAHLFRWASTLVGLVSLLGPGRVFFRGAMGAIRSRTPHLDIPLALGLGVGGVGGVIHAIRGTGDLYFDSLSVLVFLLLVGRFIQSRGQRLAAQHVSLLRLLTPRKAHRWLDGRVETIPVEAIQQGDILEVRVGEMIPADGEVTLGESHLDESLLTGEADPREVNDGSIVTAGSNNLSAVIQLRVTAAGSQSRVGKLAGLVEADSSLRAPTLDWAHRASGYFVVIVLIVAVITGVIGYQVSSQTAFERVVALLVVSCPCALGLATPLALAVAQGRAAKRRILIKGSQAIEQLAKPGRIWLDKTGTLTEGKLTLREWVGPHDLEEAVAAIEQESSHPLARSLVKGIEQRCRSSDRWPAVTQVRHWQGGGISGVVDGRRIEIGSTRRLNQLGWNWQPGILESGEEFASRGWTPIVVGVDGEVVVAIGMGDQIRSDARDSVAQLQSWGWQVGILSGDHPASVAQVAREVGIEPKNIMGGLSPEEKLQKVRSREVGQRVVMVGDGINDSAALAAASVGVAVHGGAEASMNSALVYLAEPGLWPLINLIDGSSKTMKVVSRNLAASIFYNGLAASLAVAGIINPLIAALLMPASSLTVVTMSLCTSAYGAKR